MMVVFMWRRQFLQLDKVVPAVDDAGVNERGRTGRGRTLSCVGSSTERPEGKAVVQSGGLSCLQGRQGEANPPKGNKEASEYALGSVACLHRLSLPKRRSSSGPWCFFSDCRFGCTRRPRFTRDSGYSWLSSAGQPVGLQKAQLPFFLSRSPNALDPQLDCNSNTHCSRRRGQDCNDCDTGRDTSDDAFRHRVASRSEERRPSDCHEPKGQKPGLSFWEECWN
jgi:hypothetical protein